MAKAGGQNRDFVELPRGVVEQAIGQKMGGSPYEIPIDLRNQNVGCARLARRQKGRQDEG